MSLSSISIVVPSFNQGQYLEDTITSILNQNYPNLELFVVDGGSNDNSVDIIKKYARQIKWWVSEKDKGQSDAINKGFSRCSGDIITWINSDDLLMPGALHSVSNYFQEDYGIGLVHGGIILFKEQHERSSDLGYKDPSIERNLAGMAFSQPSAFFLKKYFDQVGGKLSEELHFGMDYDLYSRLALVCRFKPVKETLAKYRLHDNSKTVTEQHKFIGDWLRVFVNLCRNLRWDDVLNELKLALGSSGNIDYYKPFPFEIRTDLVDRVDKRKLLFYHLCYHVKAYYIADRFDDAKRTLKYIKANFDPAWINAEKSIPPVIRNLKYPDFVIKFMQKLKKNS